MRGKSTLMVVINALLAWILVLVFLAVLAKSYWTNKKTNDVSSRKNKIIGVVATYELDRAKRQKYGEQYGYLYDKYFLRARYVDNVARVCKDNNVTFIIIPSLESAVERYADIVDGVIFTGGDDIHSKYFHQPLHPAVQDVELDRNIEFYLSFYRHLINQQKPILGICLGAQLINVVSGGDLIQDIPSEINTTIQHAGNFYLDGIHDLHIKDGSRLKGIVGTNTIRTGSNHHQSVGKLGDGITATAQSSDGVIEAIEKPDYQSFLLGVQWHVEAAATENDRNIVKAFCDAVEHGTRW